jgi:hypothetical protein
MQGTNLGHTGPTWPGASALKVFNRNDCDAAWENDTRPTNYRLRDGDTVVLKTDTKGQFLNGYFTVPAETSGVVVTARTARVAVFDGTKSQYFANVDVVIDGKTGRIRVPHGALRTTSRKH